MTSNNSGWIMGAPKEGILSEWELVPMFRRKVVTLKLEADQCTEFIKAGVPCYRHRPIKKEESK